VTFLVAYCSATLTLEFYNKEMSSARKRQGEIYLSSNCGGNRKRANGAKNSSRRDSAHPGATSLHLRALKTVLVVIFPKACRGSSDTQLSKNESHSYWTLAKDVDRSKE
jgi:hypothetical protein